MNLAFKFALTVAALLLFLASAAIAGKSAGAGGAAEKEATDLSLAWPDPQLASIPAGHKQGYFKVGGMCCASCANGAQTAVGKLAGVDSASADTKTGVLMAVYDPEKLKEAEIEAAIVKAGYTNDGRGQAGVWSRIKQADGTVKLALEVRGMTCLDCSNSIEASVAKLAGVDSVVARDSAKACVVVYDPAKVKESEIAQAITVLGFSVASEPVVPSLGRPGASGQNASASLILAI